MSRESALGALETFLGAGQFLARGARGFQRSTGVAVGFGQCIFCFLQAVGAGAPRGFRALHFADERAALLGENLRRIFQFGAVAFGLDDALLERGDLVARALLAFEPTGLVGGERRQPAVGEFRLAHDRLLLGLHLGEPGALGRDIVAYLRKLFLEIGGRCKSRQARARLRSWRPLLRRGSWSAARGLRPAPKGARPDD